MRRCEQQLDRPPTWTLELSETQLKLAAATKRAEAAEAEIALWKRQYENLEDNVIEVARNWPRGGARGQQVTAYDMLLEVARRHKYKTSDERQALAEPEGKPHE